MLARRNAILVLMAVELMLNAVNINLVAFDVWLRDELLAGQVFTLFVITIAAAEVGLGLAIILLVFRNRQHGHELDLRSTKLGAEAEDAARDRRSTSRCSRRSCGTSPGSSPDRAGRGQPSRSPSPARCWRCCPPWSWRRRQSPGRTLARCPGSRARGWRPSRPGRSTSTLALRVDGFAALVSLAVAVVALAVQVYSTAYLKGDPRYSSYAALVSLFTAAMLLVVFADDLMVLLVGWEVMGVCSYFLIGHHWEQEGSRASAVKAFVVTRLGDVGFLFGIFVLGHRSRYLPHHRRPGRRPVRAHGARSPPCSCSAGSSASRRSSRCTPGCRTRWPARRRSARSSTRRRWSPPASTSSSGCTTSSSRRPVTLAVLAVIAAVTMLGAALAALAQDDIKRVLAYSTVSQLAYMLGGLAVGVGGRGRRSTCSPTPRSRRCCSSPPGRSSTRSAPT